MVHHFVETKVNGAYERVADVSGMDDEVIVVNLSANLPLLIDLLQLYPRVATLPTNRGAALFMRHTTLTT